MLDADTANVPVVKRNRELFEKIAAQIEETPDRWNQSNWAYKDETCGTVMCVAGWAAELTCGIIEVPADSVDYFNSKDTILVPAIRNPNVPNLGFEQVGREALGLEIDDASEMFYGTWSEECGNVHEAAEFLRAFGRGEAHFGPNGGIVWGDRP